MYPYLSIFFILIALATSAQNRPLPDYARDWKRADSLAAKGLPKSALEIVTRIYSEAKAQKNYAQVAKAAMHRMIFRSYSDENAYVELIRSVKTDIADTPEPARSVLQSVLADIYWQYFQQNRYKFYNRATVNIKAAQPAKATDSTAADFRTWDARQLVEAATAAYLASVRSKEILQKTPIADFEVLLEKGDPNARPLRPTLFDLLAHRALDFFQNTEPDLLKPVFKFELDQPDYLATPDVFVKRTVQSQDSLSGRYQALLLYQQLLAFHLPDTNPDALADVDVLRLAFIYAHSVVPNRDLLYRQTLEKQIAQFKNTPVEAVYAYQLAEFLSNHGEAIRSADDDGDSSVEPVPGPNHWNRKQAADICRNIIRHYPKTLSGQKATRLLAQLMEPFQQVTVERVTAPNQPFRALITYQNVSKITYRVISVSLSDIHAFSDNIAYDEERRKSLLATWLKRPHAVENSVTLPDDGDMNRHLVEIPITGLPIGQYLILATSDDKFQPKLESVQYAFFTVSSLSYLATPNGVEESGQTLFVANRVTGQPIKNASIRIVESDGIAGMNPRKLSVTDDRGQAKIPGSSLSNRFQYLIVDGNDSLLSDQQYYYGYNRTRYPEESQTHVALFTDRAIYRPGQPIYVKGLVYAGKTNQYAVIAGRDLTIELRDRNGERISEQTLPTNEFGTFTTSFTAPVGRLTGLMSLQTPFGSISIRVEEYKRPTFEVKVKPIRQSFKLGQTVSLTAEAKTFSGALLDKAAVRYRVVRKLHQRWYWWYMPRSSSQTEIASGTAQTDERGSVNISFTASPDLEKARQDNPVFDFEVTIDVTDPAGETRSTTETLRIGYTALQAELSIPPQIEKGEPVTFPVKITNQSGEEVKANGQLIVYKLQPPTHPLRNRLWSRPDRQFLSRAEFERLFPNDLYANEADPRSWPKGEIVQQQAIVTPTEPIKPDLNRYTAGEYLAEITVTDSSGETSKDQAFFMVLDEKQPTASARPDGWLQVRKASAEPGEKATFWVGNSQPGWVLMTVEENRSVVRQEWIKTDGRPQRVTLPVTEKQRGGFAGHFAMIQNGRLYQKSQLITVPFTNKQLSIETQTFRNKLKPGEREEWTLKISGLDKLPAEVVATLYDASLDAFVRLNWPTSFYQAYYPLYYDWQSNSFVIASSSDLYFHSKPLPPVSERRYDQLSWMGYRFSFGSRPFPYRPDRPFGLSDNALRVSVKQTGQVISGTIKNADGSGAPGIMILQKGTKKGTTTDANGKFSLRVDSASKSVTLVFSYVGYRTNEVAITKKGKTFKLLADVNSLNEVVVVGYGTQARRDVTGAVAMRKAAPMAAAPGRIEELKEAVAAEPSSAKDSNSPAKQPELINPRRNFNETAFFIPQLKTDEEGRVVLKFTMPEALTRWRLLAFAHTKDMKTGILEREIVTQKELMITANAPRFLREGDTIQVRARLTNLSDRPLYDATANLFLTNALTGEPLTSPQRVAGDQVAMLAPGLSTSVGWTIIVPSNLDAVTCRLTAQSGTFTDGEEFTIPILPNRMLITDSQPFWVNGKEKKEFKLKPLTNLNPELPVRHERLTVEVTSNPSWYALQSLPYLMEYRYECAEQLFSRLYANSLATHIVNSKPVFKQVIAEWQKAPPKSPLESNEELKAVALENSPWLVSARSEADRQAKLGQLLDANRMESEQLRAFDKLQQLQTPSGNPAGGGFRWFGGMDPNLSITLHILSGLGHLQKLGVRFPDEIQEKLADMQTNAIRYADAEMKHWVEQQQKAEAQQKPKGVSIWYFSATQYLYARSFYLDKPLDKTVQAYLTQRLVAQWLSQSLQGQALSAMTLSRFGDTKTANMILASLRERTRKSEELGTYWPDNVSGLYWYQTPIETQAYLIEAFSEINPVQAEIDDMKRWLLRQKQTQSWSSTKATTEAIYALLLRGTDWLGTGVTTQVSLGGQSIESRVTKADAITGYEKVTYAAAEIKPEMGAIQITKTTDGPAWGALYWQHFEPLDRVMPGSAGLSVQKSLYVQRDSPSGPLISPVTEQTSLKPGELIKVRLILKTDRVMEYVHLKDSRASGFEPVAALSGYKYQNGLGYYESPRDASTDFFMSYLPVGTHVFEYDLRVAQTGDFSAGVATVQCFYAPEFSAHSAGERVRVK